MRQRLLHQPSEDAPAIETDPGRLSELRSGGGFAWLDIEFDDGEEVADVLAAVGAPPAMVDDVLDIELLPKVDRIDSSLIVVFHAAAIIDEDRLDTQEIDLLVDDGLLLSVRRSEVGSIDWLWKRAQRSPKLFEADPLLAVARIGELIGRRFLDLALELEVRVDALAQPALDGDPDVLGDVQVLRRDVSTIRKIVRPQQTVLRRLAKDETALMTAGAAQRFSDAIDVHDQVAETFVESRGLLSDVLDTYRGVSAQRQAEATTVLTVYAAVMLPLSLIVGFFGMNFTGLPGTRTDYGWIIAFGLMALVLFGSWAYFVRRGYIEGLALPRAARVGRGLAAAARVPVSRLPGVSRLR